MGNSIKKISSNYFTKNRIDAHLVKKDYGAKPLSRYDLYHERDKENFTVTIRDKNGNLFMDLGMGLDDMTNMYSNTLERGV